MPINRHITILNGGMYLTAFPLQLNYCIYVPLGHGRDSLNLLDGQVLPGWQAVQLSDPQTLLKVPIGHGMGSGSPDTQNVPKI